MDSRSRSSQTLRVESPATSPPAAISQRHLDLSGCPPIAVLSAHLQGSEEEELKERLRQCGAHVTTDVSEARIWIGKVGTKRRAEFELRARKLVVEGLALPVQWSPGDQDAGPPRKKRKGSHEILTEPTDGNRSTTEDEGDHDSETEDEAPRQEFLSSTLVNSEVASVSNAKHILNEVLSSEQVFVVKADWLDACALASRIVAFGDSLVYRGKVLKRPTASSAKPIEEEFTASSQSLPASRTALAARPQSTHDILTRAKANAPPTSTKPSYKVRRGGASTSDHFNGRTFASSTQTTSHTSASRTAHLLQQATSENDGEDSDIPPPPDWVKKRVKYACQRCTPANGPNEDFLNQLKKIRTARTLIGDEIGIRAYSTIIASIAAYPYKLSHPREVAQLPGCDEKTAVLFAEWKNTTKIEAVEDYENDEAMKVLRVFYDIWGVGAKTARYFYYDKHWTELDDVIDYGWNGLDRVQQIGLKYYEEFLDHIPRAEVEQIASVVREHAIRLRDDRVTVTIVGGYRRGKAASGDVDLIVSHPNFQATAGFVQEIVDSLERAEWITHTLTMSLTNTHRGQNILPFRSVRNRGAGFDTLDKALVVWQNPSWPSRTVDRAANPAAKNPNIHRRVDIIISPWRTVGCAVMGWSGGTTFQRDLRRYAKAVKGWKFDSSGIRSRATGEPVMLEGENGVEGTPEDAEKRVFEGIGLEFVPPEMRVTG